MPKSPYGVGVRYQPNSNKLNPYNAYYTWRENGKPMQKHIGNYRTPQEARQAWNAYNELRQKAKKARANGS